ncbi:hypothetical protein ACFOGG_05145 [Brenneria rubrifaciens]|uniref:hypothetical protein n=1 Tax=Brenneria rubrifaciens TaxID=55213 RepID=UPI00361BF6E7
MCFSCGGILVQLAGIAGSGEVSCRQKNHPMVQIFIVAMTISFTSKITLIDR